MSAEETKIIQFHNEVFELVLAGRISAALNRMLPVAQTAKQQRLVARINKRIVACNLLFSSIESGAEDPMRNELWNTLCEETAKINDILTDKRMRINYYGGLYYYRYRDLQAEHPSGEKQSIYQYLLYQAETINRVWEATKQTQVSLQKLVGIIDELDQRFVESVYASPVELSAKDLKAIRTAILTPRLPMYLRCLLLAALTQGLLHRFDADKIAILIDCIEADEDRHLVMRAWVGLALILLRHSERAQFNTRLLGRLETLRKQKGGPRKGYRPLQRIQMDLYMAYDGDEHYRSYKEDVMPELERIAKASPDPSAINLNKLLSQMVRENQFPNKRMRDAVQSYQKFIEQGGDPMVIAYKNATKLPRHLYTFRLNWLRPYLLDDPMLKRDYTIYPESERTAEIVNRLQHFCDIDRFMVFYANLHTTRKDSLLSNKILAEETANEMKIPVENIPPQCLDEFEARGYIRDLWRFYETDANRSTDFVNVFEGRDVHLCARGVMSAWFDDADRAKYAAYLFKRRRYAEAFYIYQHMSQSDMDRSTLQKYAYSAYTKANPDKDLAERLLIDCNKRYPGHEWTLRFLAQYYIRRQDYSAAHNLLAAGLDYMPDNYSMRIEIAECLIHLGQYDAALGHLYHAEEIANKDQDARRVIAWCLVLKGDMAQAEVYAQKMMKEGNRSIDWVNAALVALAAGDTKTAVSRALGSFWVHKPWSVQEYDDYLRRIEPDLLAHGFDAPSLHLVRESVIMKQLYKR